MARPLSNDARRTALEHARELLLDAGVAGLSFEALARNSGVAKTTLYRHWPTRPALLQDTLMELVPPPTVIDTGALRTDLERWAASRHDASLDAPTRRIFFLLMEASIADPAVREVQASMLARQIDPLRAMVTNAIARGELDAGTDVDLAIDLVLGPMISRTLIRDVGTDDRERSVLIDAALASIRSTSQPQ